MAPDRTRDPYTSFPNLKGSLMPKQCTRVLLTAIIALIPVLLKSQQPTATSSAAAGQIAPGTLIQVEITNDIDVKKVHAGDTFRTRLWDDVRSGDKIVLPQKSIIIGHVVEAHPRTKDSTESRLVIAFDKAQLKNGGEIPIHGVVARVQLSPIAAAAAAHDNNSHAFNPSMNPGSTTNIAMPAQLPSPAEGPGNPMPSPGPTNINDPDIAAQGDASGNSTLTSTKADLKLKHYASLDIRITDTAH
jgi:hypothetical protein